MLTLTTREENMVQRWTIKLLRKIYGRVMETVVWRIWRNKGCSSSCMKNRNIKWDKNCKNKVSCHLWRMGEERMLKRIVQSRPGRKRPKDWTCAVEDRRNGGVLWKKPGISIGCSAEDNTHTTVCQKKRKDKKVHVDSGTRN